MLLFLLIFSFEKSGAQIVDVQADYNSTGDCIFSAYNKAEVPMFLHINFAELQYTTFSEPLPYVKQLTFGYNSLFTLYQEGNQALRFQYDLKSYRSNPTANVDLSFSYLIPFKPGAKVTSKNVKSIVGFRGDDEPESWLATGFVANEGDEIYAARRGIVVEISGQEKKGDPLYWYNTWNYSVTLLQPDGTLICYRNIRDKDNRLELNQKIYAGDLLGEVIPEATELIVLIYHNTISGLSSTANQNKRDSDELKFILPQFAVNENDSEVLNTAKEYIVVHPLAVRGLEMSKREKKKILGNKR